MNTRAIYVSVDPSHPTTAEVQAPGVDPIEGVTANDLRELAADAIRCAQAMELWQLDGATLDERLESTVMASVSDVPA